MEIYANELSITDETLNNYENIKKLADAYKLLVTKGIGSCRISNEVLNQMYIALNCAEPQKKNILYFIYSFFHAPFDTDEVVEYCAEEYILHSWTCRGKQCVGLPYASIMDSLTVSLGDEEWKSIVQVQKDEENVDVRNVSNQTHVEEYDEWIDSLKDIVLLKSDIKPEDKSIHLRDDHGKDKLMDFSKKICKSPYVLSVVNSLPFNPKDRNFIRNVKADGLVECVMCWTDKGYGLVIQTTGRNIRETQEIADKLKKEYGE